MFAQLRRALALAACCALAAGATTAEAAITGGPDVIAPPPSVLNEGVTNDHQQGFDERQHVTLSSAVAIDNAGAVPAGAIVDSHMIFLNQAAGATTTTDLNRIWQFDGPVLGVMSDGPGALEVASTPALGALGVLYPLAPFTNRGLEVTDAERGAGGSINEGYTISGSSITVGMTVSQPGDWIRVLTQTPRVSCDSAMAGPVTLWPPNHALKTVTIGGVSNVTITSVMQDEPTDGTGDGDLSPDATPGTTPGTVKLRAERSGTGDGRVYQITFSAVAGDGSPCEGAVTVTVPHDQASPAVGSAPGGYDSFGS